MKKPRRRKRYRLKAWSDKRWQRKLGSAVTVSRVDEDIPTDHVRGRKPWHIALTQNRVPHIDGLPPGQTLLLSEHDVMALLQYLFEPQLAIWGENPDQRDGVASALLYAQPGMFTFLGPQEIANVEAYWSPAHFKRLAPIDPSGPWPTAKMHTLPGSSPRQ